MGFSRPPGSRAQIAVAVLARDVDATAGNLKQFATGSGPALLDSAQLPAILVPDFSNDQLAAILDQTVRQLARLGIVLRGPVTYPVS